MNKYLFLTIPNNSGSTVLYKLFRKCRKARLLSEEGHIVYSGSGPRPKRSGCSRIWTEMEHIFSNPERYNWKKIKERWADDWKNGKDGLVFVEKSPPNVLRAEMLQKQFSNPHFILNVVNQKDSLLFAFNSNIEDLRIRSIMLMLP